MALPEAVQGAKRPSPEITWGESADEVLDLTGATITARIRSLPSGTVRAADGVFTVVDAEAGVFRWDYGTTDVATAGLCEVQFTASFGAAPTPARTISAEWRVREAY